MRSVILLFLALITVPGFSRIVGVAIKVKGGVYTVSSTGTTRPLVVKGPIFQGVTLRLDTGARVSLLLFSGRVKTIAGPAKLIVSVAALQVRYHEVLSQIRNTEARGVTRWTGATRGSSDGARLKIISPRGRLAGKMLRVRWMSRDRIRRVEGTLYIGRKKIWSGRVVNGRLVRGIRLEEGTIYRFTIRGRANDGHRTAASYFKLLSPRERRRLNIRLKAMRRKGLTRGMLHYLRSVTYAAFQVYDRASVEYRAALRLIPDLARLL